MPSLKLVTVLLTLAISAEAQLPEVITTDTTRSVTTTKFSDFKAQKRLVSKDHVLLWTTNLILSHTENLILELEEREATAMLKRDTAALRKLWMRDFTLDDVQSEIMVSNNPLPFYISIHRVVDFQWSRDNFISVSGQETTQSFKANGSPQEPVTTPFRHIWSSEKGEWKLMSRTGD